MIKRALYTLVFSFFVSGVFAAQMCVKPLNTKEWLCVGGGGLDNYDWGGRCLLYDDTDITVDFYGIASCSSFPGGGRNVISGKEFRVMWNTQETLSDARFCWCRMIKPAMSAWVFSTREFDSAEKCFWYCDLACGDYVHMIVDSLFLSLEN